MMTPAKKELNIDKKGIFFVSSVAGMSIISGFSYALSMAKRSDPNSFFQGAGVPSKSTFESGSRLALRALGYGSFLSIASVGLITGVIWGISGATNHYEFKERVGQLLPPIKRKNPERGRENFDNLKELADYLTEEDLKNAKRQNKS